VPWRRRVGGQFGVTVDLPAGAISDDTQLRLATCRSMLPDGSFDVETFSKIELPVWLAYALGAGRGSRAAATHLVRRDATWASNSLPAEAPTTSRVAATAQRCAYSRTSGQQATDPSTTYCMTC
jgi:hypothetical protein